MKREEQKVLYVTGGTGFIGGALVRAWLCRSAQHHAIIQTRQVNASGDGRVRFVSRYDQIELDAVDALVNLAGAPIADARWTQGRKKAIENSRIRLTAELANQGAAAKIKPRVVISGSAIGYCGYDNPEVDESAPKGAGYAADLCARWEQSAAEFEQYSRTVIARIGVVLGSGGGVLNKLLPLYRFGLGGPIGSGQQWFSWVHLEDLVSAVLMFIDNASMSGVYNLTSPGSVRQKDFARTLAGAVHRPAVLPTPALAMKLIFGQMAQELLIGGQKVLPARLLDAGFDFQYPELVSALEDLLNR